MTWEEWWEDRGHPAEHDPGPPRNRKWLRLFAETPNYRALGVAVTGRETFRWHFGPIFYRGRLRDGEVKVLIVGQEGAQDESLAHRSFTGGTGARLQHLLHHIGITRSYLFLNTFCYPIFGQYGDHLRWLAQDPDSPVAVHRNRLFDYVLARNDLQLAIGVGSAAKESIASWLHTHGVAADPFHLEATDATSVSPGLRVLGVLHPGGAASGSSAAVEADFRRAVATVASWRMTHSGWLAADSAGSVIPADEYRYRSHPIPFRDLPFGTTWRLGRGGTSSNRQDDQRSIQLFSAGGHYNGRGDNLSYRTHALGSEEGYGQDPEDLPYEPPRHSYRHFDEGPDAVMAGLLTPPWPSMEGAVAHPSLGFGPIYRGRLADVTLLVLAEHADDDDLFTGRALSGEDGQHLQRWMESVGVDRRYLILRVPPFDASGVTRRRREEWVDHPATAAAYDAILKRITARSPRLGVVVTVGSVADRLATRLDLNERTLLTPRGRGGWLESWRDAALVLADRDYRRDLTRPDFRYLGSRSQIPRRDLPYGTLRWQGSSGRRAVQGEVDGEPSGDYYKLFAPRWVFELAPAPLSAAESKAVAGA